MTWSLKSCFTSMPVYSNVFLIIKYLMRSWVSFVYVVDILVKYCCCFGSYQPEPGPFSKHLLKLPILQTPGGTTLHSLGPGDARESQSSSADWQGCWLPSICAHSQAPWLIWAQNNSSCFLCASINFEERASMVGSSSQMGHGQELCDAVPTPGFLIL